MQDREVAAPSTGAHTQRHVCACVCLCVRETSMAPASTFTSSCSAGGLGLHRSQFVHELGPPTETRERRHFQSEVRHWRPAPGDMRWPVARCDSARSPAARMPPLPARAGGIQALCSRTARISGALLGESEGA